MNNRPPVVALIGAGGIASPHLAAWLALGATVRIHSVEGAERLAAGAARVEVAPDLDAALDGAEIADICTPTPSHPEVAAAAAAAGVHVVCEKPLALTAAAADEMQRICAEAGVRLFPGHVVRFFPEYRAMRAHVASGALGPIAVQRFSRTGTRPAREWFYDTARSGGIVMDQMIHDLDFARWTAGEVVRVHARATSGGPQGVSSAQIVLTHDGGALSYVTGTWAAPGTAFRTTFEIAGPAGLVHHDSAAHTALRVDGGDAGASRGLLPAAAFGESPYLTELRAFFEAVRGGPEPPVDAADGVAAVRLGEAANESLATGRAVELRPAGVVAA
ncbi:Gfo/Idh/MocA family protein [Naumannella huperziae]